MVECFVLGIKLLNSKKRVVFLKWDIVYLGVNGFIGEE